jgi:predicted dehydrogenase
MKSISRRRFLSNSSVAAIGLSGALRRIKASNSPNERIAIAVIGAGGMGGFHLGTLAARPDARVACICDVDERARGRGAEKVNSASGKTPQLTGDFRHVLDDRSIDAVVIATPHHWHCPIALRALEADKDIYLEKPASHVFREGRLLVEAAEKSGRIVQHGTQMRSSEVTAAAGKALADGILGEVKMSKAWTVQRLRPPAPRPDTSPPAGVDYDRWLGPAPARPFNPNRFHVTWRGFRDYGNGDIGDDGAHDLDMARWGLGVTTHPVRITAHGSRIDLPGDWEYPDNMTVAYQYADDKVLLYEERAWTPYGMHGFDSGNAFYGTEGYMIFSRRGYFQTYLGPKEEKGPGMGERGRVGQPAPAHLENFLECVRTRAQPHAPAEVAHLSCGLIHLGEIAYRTGRVLHFDPETETFPNDAEANAFLTKEYREPWDVPPSG